MKKYFSCDFETTTDPNDCRVWAWGVEDIHNFDDFRYGNSIDGFFNFMQSVSGSNLYFHNLRFDGEFLIHELFKRGFKHVINERNPRTGKLVNNEETRTFTTLISDKGQFYSIKIIFEKIGKKTKAVTIYDSLKVLPFSVAQIAKGFNLPVSKLEIDYKEFRPVGHELTQTEIDYLHADVDIVARALNVLFSQGMNKMTQASNAFNDYKETVGKKNFERWFPLLDVDRDIRQAYKGGFTYLNPKYKNVDIGTGLVFDVNSLYPWVLHDCPLPYGEPIFFEGKYEPDPIYNLYVQMITCSFELKPDHIPTIQMKNNLMFVPTQYLERSEDHEGNLIEVTMCLSSVDIELLFEHYEVYNPVFHSGWKFKSTTGLFSEYIDKWTEVKIQAGKEGNKAMRTLAKLMLNALYGRFGLNPNVQSKIPYLDNDVVKYKLGAKEKRKPVYIPVAVFVTAWARHKTITTAQKLYDKFCYADTDSVHLDIELPESILNMPNDELEKLTTAELKEMGVDLPEGFEVDPYALGAWKCESRFYRARFIRQKTYAEDWNTPDTWNTDKYNKDLLNITCAGMPENCYQFVTWENFKEGASYAGKLMPKHVAGGIVLNDIEFTIKKI